MIRRCFKSLYSSSAGTQLIGNKIKVLMNTLFKGVHLRVKNVNLIGNITLHQLNITSLNLQYSNKQGKLSTNINMLALINQNIDFECYCNIESKFKQIEQVLVIQQLKAQIKSKSDPITSMVIENSINEYIGKYKVKIPEKVKMIREILKVEEDDENDVIVFDYEQWKERKDKQTQEKIVNQKQKRQTY